MNINEFFKEMEEYASINNVPIMRKDAIDYICDFIREKNIKDTLEIGTAICYSTLKMADAGTNVVTIERDEEREIKAKENLSLSGLNNVKLIYGDALETEIDGMFDLILIDAAKGQNKRFLEKYKTNLKQDGYVIIDNIDFHGLVGKSSEIKSKNLRSLVRKIEDFIDYLDNQKEFKVSKINKGDGLILLERI